MFKVGDTVVLKSISDLIEDGTFENRGLRFTNEAIGDDKYVLLTAIECRYMGHTGTVIATGYDGMTFVDGNDYLGAEPDRPLAVQMGDGTIIRLLPDYMVVPMYNDIEDEDEDEDEDLDSLINIFEDEELVMVNAKALEGLCDYATKLEQEVKALRRLLAYSKAKGGRK